MERWEENEMYPIQNEVRNILSLDGMWKFQIDKGNGEKEAWQEHFPSDYEELYVPASYNDQREDPSYRNHCGKVYYEKAVTVPSVFRGQRLVLRFDAVAHDAVVWIDGEELVRHRGGFLPFEADITERVTPGKEFRITVSADNTLSHASLPIGNEDTAFFGSDNAQVPAVQAAKKHRPKTNLPNFDFFNYAGINRPVRIYTTPREYIEDLTIVPQIEGCDGLVSIQTVCGGERTGAVPQIRILDREGNEVAAANGEAVSIRIPSAHLWEPYPGDPYLYRAEIRLGEDRYCQEFGIRTVEVAGREFRINGKPFYFKGFGKHEDFYLSGRGTNPVVNVKDVSLLHWLHANSFRTSHYPYAEEMYQLCDREGIVVIDETPAVGIGAGGTEDPYLFPIREYHRQVLQDLVQRDKNHPCVVMWSMGNEPDTENFPESALDYWTDLYHYTHGQDPQNRPVTFVCCQNDYTRDLVTRTMDVVCINRYYGWYNLSGDMDSACYAWDLELDFWEAQNKPVMVTEYGCDTLPGLHGTPAEMWTEEFQVEYYRRIDALFDKRTFFVGEQLWCFADFNSVQGVFRADGNRKGVFNRERRPKMAAHWLRERWAAIPNFGYKETGKA